MYLISAYILSICLQFQRFGGHTSEQYLTFLPEFIPSKLRQMFLKINRMNIQKPQSKEGTKRLILLTVFEDICF